MQKLKEELIKYLDSVTTINSHNIGQIRASCFVPWESEWNGIVRDETASREKDFEDDLGELDASKACKTKTEECESCQ